MDEKMTETEVARLLGEELKKAERALRVAVGMTGTYREQLEEMDPDRWTQLHNWAIEIIDLAEEARNRI